MIRSSLIALALLAPAPLAAHPHVFVDTELTVQVNDAGKITGTEMTWTYDEYFTLLILEDMGLDADMDGELTEDERAELMGFDFVTWPEGFEGDLYLDAGGEKVALGHPVSTGIALTDGKIVATHTRTVPEAPAEGAVFRQYDPTYYVAYTLADVSVTGGCRADVTAADPDDGERALAEALDSYSEDEFQVLELGIHYADTIRLTCAQPS